MTHKKRPFNRRDQILDEATLLFSHRGYQATSIRMIADACEITEAAIYRHFKSKDDLYVSVIGKKAEQHDIRGTLQQKAHQGTIEDALGLVARHILSLAETDPELMTLMFRNSFQPGPVTTLLFREIRLPYIQFLRDEMTYRMTTGEIRDIDPLISARCFVGMVMDCALNNGVWNKISDTEFMAENVVCNNVPIFARGLTTDKPDHS